MTNTNLQYERMAQAAGQILQQRNPAQLAKLTGFHWDGRQLTAATLGIPIAISWSDLSITPRLDMWHELTILQYLANAAGTLPVGQFLSLSDFRVGGMVRGTSFDRENNRILERIGTLPVSSIREAAAKLGGSEFQGRADFNAVFSFLPHIPMQLNLWLEDEDFPASGKVLFDASAETDLQVEAAGTAASILLTLLEQETAGQ